VHQSLNDIGLLCGAESAFIIKFENNNSQCKFEFIWENPNLKNIKTIDTNPPAVFASEINKLLKNDHFYLKSIKELTNELKPIKQYLIINKIENLMGFSIYIGTKLYGFLGIQNISKDGNWSKNEFVLLRSAGEVLCNSIQRKLNEDQIMELNIQLNEKNNEIEQVLYITSHDIRSPLVNIIGFTKELNKSVDELIENLNKETITLEDRVNINYLIREDIPEVLKYINSGGIKIDKLLSSLLSLSRLGRTTMELTKVNTGTIVEEIIESMEFQVQTHKIEVKVTELPEIVTDKYLFTQIMNNLIDNAIKYHDESKQSFLYIGAETHQHEILFIVEDNGIGIPEHKREKVFEIFNRLNPEKAEGEGIGLTIIKKAVERLHGKIILESEEGKGCKFTLILENTLKSGARTSHTNGTNLPE
jgi:signal transduction histidine kinase